MQYKKLADSFDALKKKERIKTLVLALDDRKKVSDIVEEVGISDSTVRNYLNDFEEAELIEKTEQNGYQYTDYGRRFRANMEVFVMEEEAKWLETNRERLKDLQSVMKTERKRLLKQKLGQLV
jgi:predicted transcriptional regulator